jgi:hypothetical protein
MRRILIAAGSACAIASASAGTASAATADASATTDHHVSSVAAHVSGASGIGTPKDWYGLYQGTPDGSNWATNLVDSQWQWAQTAHSYVTSQTSGDDLYNAYWTYENGAYVLQSYAGPKDIFCS